MQWVRKSDGSLAYGYRQGDGNWYLVPREFWPASPPGYGPDGQPCASPPTMPVAPRPAPGAIRQFMRDIGERGRNERCRRFACRNVRAWIRFCRRYGYSPNRVKAAPVMASPEVRRYLRGNASLGGQERARKYTSEQLKAWAAMGGRAKAAKRRRLPPQHSL